MGLCDSAMIYVPITYKGGDHLLASRALANLVQSTRLTSRSPYRIGTKSWPEPPRSFPPVIRKSWGREAVDPFCSQSSGTKKMVPSQRPERNLELKYDTEAYRHSQGRAGLPLYEEATLTSGKEKIHSL